MQVIFFYFSVQGHFLFGGMHRDSSNRMKVDIFRSGINRTNTAGEGYSKDRIETCLTSVPLVFDEGV